MARKGLLLFLVLLVGCGPAGGGGDDDAPDGPPVPPGGAIVVTPADQELIVDNGMAATLDYTAMLVLPGGTQTDVTTEAMFAVDHPALGTFAGRRFTSATDKGGHTRVRASARGKMGDTGLTVRLSAVVIGPGATPDAPTRFGGADDPARAPALVYPEDKVLVPPNLNELEFHFMPGAGNTLFELRFVGSALDLKVYFGCTALGPGCVYKPEEAVWQLLSDAERGQDPVTYAVRGVDGASPGGVGASLARTIAFGQEDIEGGLYYWNAGAGAIMRYDFGRRGQSAERFLDAGRAGAMTCVGCHVLSRDGARIAAGLDIPAPSIYKVFDVATRSVIYGQGSLFGGGGANFFAFSPDNGQIMTSNGISIAWRDAASGAAIADPLVPVGAMPDWSPDNRMVYARPESAPPCPPFGGCGAPGVDHAGLELMAFDGAGWSGATTLVPYAGQNNYYPSFSPDSSWVIFNRSPGNMSSYDAPDAQVWAVPSTGGDPIHLATASTGGGGDSWPKWGAFLQMYRGRPILWFTFSSRRAYGLKPPYTPSGADKPAAQIWMAAFDPARAAAGMDPSLPAFWLPFQEYESGNHIAQWVTTVNRQPCAPDECPSGEFCENGFCVPIIP